MRTKKNLIAFFTSALLSVPVAATLLSPSVASAKWKRYNAQNVCMAQDNNLALGTGGSFTGNTPHVAGTSNQTVICGLPGDSTFPHNATNAINVHVRRNAPYSAGWWFGVRACVQDYQSNTNFCNDAIAINSAIGEHTASLTGGYLNYVRNASYAGWGAYVYTWFRAGDLVRFIFQDLDG